MKNLLSAFFLLFAGADNRALARQLDYLRAENRILRGKLHRRLVLTGAVSDGTRSRFSFALA